MNCVLAAAVDTSAVLSEAGMTVLIGLIVVFATLLLLTFVFWMFGVVAGKGRKSESKEVTPAVPTPAVPTPAPSPNRTPVVEDGVSDEVVAVITAAIAAMSDGGTQYTIRRIRPTSSGTRPVWAAAGIAENTQPF